MIIVGKMLSFCAVCIHALSDDDDDDDVVVNVHLARVCFCVAFQATFVAIMRTYTVWCGTILVSFRKFFTMQMNTNWECGRLTQMCWRHTIDAVIQWRAWCIMNVTNCDIFCNVVLDAVERQHVEHITAAKWWTLCWYNFPQYKILLNALLF